MIDREAVEDRVAALAERIAGREGCELVQVEYVHQSGRWILRLYIDRPEGIKIDDCATVSRQMSAVLDVEDFIPQAYNLEVSSPGLDRPLTKGDDYRRFAGEPVNIRTRSPLDGRRRFRGILQKCEGDVVTITDHAGEVFEIPIGLVSKARLDPRI